MENDEISSQGSYSSSSREIECDQLKEFNLESDLDQALLIKLPYNTIRTSHSKTNCNNKIKCKIDRHKMHQERRMCEGHKIMDGNEEVHLECPVQYKVIR